MNLPAKTALAIILVVSIGPLGLAEDVRQRPVEIRGIYGAMPSQIFERGESLADYGINAVWIGSGRLKAEDIERLRDEGAQVFAEFNTLHVANYLKEHPDAAPIGTDGQVSPPPEGWQGICPTHEAYRKFRMDDFRQVLDTFEIDGIWLDYHHSHASWERDVPILPDTCFCERCLTKFQQETNIDLPVDSTTSEKSALLLGEHREDWVNWRCDVFTDWVREFREIRDEVRPDALLGTFHCPWSNTDYDNALREKLAIDLKAQAEHIDVFSTMPYHARFGHASDPDWISRQTAWLGEFLGVEGTPDERIKIWPIVQLSDWGETVPVEQISTVIDHGTRAPSTGVMAFAWSGLGRDWDKLKAMGEAYRALRPAD
ncbi:hypothetical protein BH23PLA1_BH23PLA1_42230 [soil metagenome]